MNKEVKKRWVAALRSGRYKQGTGLLSRDEEYCCLGVLCELAVADGVIPAPRVGSDGRRIYEGQHGFPPLKVREWADFGEYGVGDPAVPTKKQRYRTLSMMNDSGESFETIARVIQRNL